VVDRRRPSSDRELDMLTSTPLVLDPVDVFSSAPGESL